MGIFKDVNMWRFHFFIDYFWIDKRVISKEHLVLVNDKKLQDKQMAWCWLKDTFEIEYMEYCFKEDFRLIHAEFIND